MKKNVESMLGYFSRIRRFYAGEINRRFRHEGFSPSEISILILLSNNPSIKTSTQLRVVLGVSKGLVSRSMDSLITRGLAVCVQDPSDKRILRIRLTAESEPLIQRLKQEIQNINEELLSDIPAEDLQKTWETLEKILDHFKEKETSYETENVKRS